MNRIEDWKNSPFEWHDYLILILICAGAVAFCGLFLLMIVGMVS